MTRRSRVIAGLQRGGAAAFTAIVLLGSCRQLAGIEEREPCDGPPADPGSCEACVRADCCEAKLACGNDAECAALDGCLRSCSGEDEDCRAECRRAQPEYFDDAFAALGSCSAAACATACGLTCGGYVYPDVECATCANDLCCDVATACATSRDCLALSFCERPCAAHDDTCRGDCRRRYPDGMEAAGALAECIAANCGDECGHAAAATDRWWCVDEEPPPAGPMEDVVFVVKRQGQPVPDLLALLCDNDDMTCDAQTSVAMGVTDLNGRVMLTFPSGFDGVFSVEQIGAGVQGTDLVKTVVRLYPTHDVQPTGEGEVFIWSWDELADLMEFVATPDPNLGLLELHAFHCAEFPGKQVGASAEGVSFELDPVDPGALPYYGGFGQVPGTATDTTGFGGFLNLAPGKYDVRFIRRDKRECVGQDTIIVRPGALTGGALLYPLSCADASPD